MNERPIIEDHENYTILNGAPKGKFNGAHSDANKDKDRSHKVTPISWIDMSDWDTKPVPVREWAIKDRVPLRQVGLFSGEGGTGKSIIELMKDVAHVTGKDWFGSMPTPGPAFYIGAEDEEDEIHRRVADIARHYGTTFKQLTEDGLYLKCLLGEDATLCTVTGKSGKIETTPLYRQLYEAAGDLKPKNISLDTLTRVFDGDEINRRQVYLFAMHMQALAMAADGSVTVLSHPSLAGLASGSGLSGSTAWHGAFRFRQYLKGIKAEKGEQPENGLRELEFKKNQYGPLGEAVTVTWSKGIFVPELSGSSFEGLAREQEINEVFLKAMERALSQGKDLSPHSTAHNYAPALLMTLPEAKEAKARKRDFEAAFERLLEEKKIHIATEGPPSKRRKRVLVGPQSEAP
jgi:RecA-family ATPase